MSVRRKNTKLNATQQRKARTLKRNLERAQRLVRRHVKPSTSLADELIAERRQE